MTQMGWEDRIGGQDGNGGFPPSPAAKSSKVDGQDTQADGRMNKTSEEIYVTYY